MTHSIDYFINAEGHMSSHDIYLLHTLDGAGAIHISNREGDPEDSYGDSPFQANRNDFLKITESCLRGAEKQFYALTVGDPNGHWIDIAETPEGAVEILREQMKSWDLNFYGDDCKWDADIEKMIERFLANPTARQSEIRDYDWVSLFPVIATNRYPLPVREAA